MTKDLINVFTENDLTRLLKLWLAPGIPRSLDRRIKQSSLWINAYQLGFASPRNTPTRLEASMKRCNACEEEFADKFSFCPVDGTPLNRLAAALVSQHPDAGAEFFAPVDPFSPDRCAAADRGEFKVTMIGGTGLMRRLAAEVSFVIRQLQRAWPAFKHDPIGSSGRALVEVLDRGRKFMLAPNVLAGGVTAMLVVLSAVATLMWFGHAAPPVNGANIEEPVVEIISFLQQQTTPPEGTGVGVASNGRVGLASGRGEGSKPEPQRSRGGGGSGNHDPLPSQQGAVPQPSAISAPINPPLPNAALPVAGTDIDPALWKGLPFPNYGDPRSKSSVASKGPGDGGAIGTGRGLGNGEGDGNGFGPGSEGNVGGGPKEPGGGGIGGSNDNHPRDPNYVFPPKEVTQRARVISKPEPGYTEEARKLDITGTVVLRVVFSVSGEVTNIHAVKPLPGGLTEKAIAAARQIRFVPAMKNGQPVPVYMQLEYNFNLY
jgi:TonB family protein